MKPPAVLALLILAACGIKQGVHVVADARGRCPVQDWAEGGYLTHLIGTPWQPQVSGRILFLEDTGEPLYRLDRMLTHLACCGMLDNLAGLLLGVFDPGHYDRLEILRLNEEVWNRVSELTRNAPYPIWGGMPIGHQHGNVALPVGMEAVMESSTGTLSFLPQSCQSCNAV